MSGTVENVNLRAIVVAIKVVDFMKTRRGKYFTKRVLNETRGVPAQLYTNLLLHYLFETTDKSLVEHGLREFVSVNPATRSVLPGLAVEYFKNNYQNKDSRIFITLFKALES